MPAASSALQIALVVAAMPPTVPASPTPLAPSGLTWVGVSRLMAWIGGTSVAEFKQNFNPFVTKLTLDFSPDRHQKLDRRLGIAAGVLLCAIEGKQEN